MSDSDLAQKFTALQARLDKLTEEQHATGAEREPEPKLIDPGRRFAEQLAASLNEAQSKWRTA